MLYRDLCRTLSVFLYMLALPLALPLGIAIYCEWIKGPEFYPQLPSAFAFLTTIIITLLLAAALHWIGRNAPGKLYRRESLLLVILVWFLAPILGSLPFSLSETLKNPLDAYFETVS